MVRGAPPAGAPAGASIASADERAVGASAGPISPPRVSRRSVPEPAERRPPGRPASIPAPAALAQGVRRALVTVRAAGRRGTGFVVDAQGYVVTSTQVVNGGGAIQVTLHDGRTVPVSAVDRDRLTGVAVLKVDAGRLPAIALGSSSGLRVGDAVVAVGGRRGDRPDLAVGTLRATGVATGGDLALDIPVVPGGGGGPLLDARGEVVGVTTAGGSTGPAGAVPIDRVKSILRQLRAGPPAPGSHPPVPSDR